MDEDTRIEEAKSPKEVEYLIHTIKNNDKDINYGLHSIGKAYANHFSGIKLKYKRLALTWLSSLLLGLFFISINNGGEDFNNISINKLYIDSLLTVLAILGVKLLSFLDVKVYHPQLGAIFLEQLKLEEKSEDLEKEYTGMAKLLHKKHFDPIITDSLYYSIIMFVIAFLGIFSLYIKFSENHSLISIGLLFSLFGIFMAYEVVSVILSIWLGASRAGGDEISKIKQIRLLFGIKRNKKSSEKKRK